METSPPSSDFAQDVEALIEDGMGHEAGIVVVSNGITNLAFEANSIFRIASVSKIVIGLSALKFFADHDIELSTPVKDLVPSLPIMNPWHATAPVRLIHLLEHTSGIQEIIASWPRHSVDSLSLEEILRQCFGIASVRWPPGTTATYSNFNYVALNRIIEHLSGADFDEVIAKNIFRPLGMRDSTFRLSQVDKKRLLPGYVPGTRNKVPIVDGPYRAAAGMYASPRDLGVFLEMLLGYGQLHGQRIVPASMVEALQVPVSSAAARDGLTLGHGPGGVRRQSNGRVYTGHNGMIEGYAARLYYNLARGEAYAVMLNTHPLQEGPSLQRIGRVIEDHFFAPASTPPPASSLSNQVERWEGFYRFENPRFRQLTPFAVPMTSGWIRADGEALWFRPMIGQDLDYVPAGKNQYRRPHEPEASLIFGTTADGDPYMFRLNNQFYRPAAAGPVLFAFATVGWSLLMLVLGLAAPLASFFLWHRSRDSGWVVWALIGSCSIGFGLSLGLGTGFRTSQIATSLNPLTLAVTATTLVYAVLALATFVYALWNCRNRQQRWVGRLACVVSGGQLLFCVVAASYGWLPLMLWF